MRYKLQTNQIALVLLFVIVFAKAYGQQLVFNKVSPPNGTDFNFVTDITQDKNGTMWYATKKGLYRYDGNQMTLYNNNPFDTNSLNSNLSESVCADNNGTIWIGSLGKGLDRLVPETGIITNFTHNPDDPKSISNDTITSIISDKEGTLWIGTHGGLDKFDSKTNQFIHYHHETNNNLSISDNQVRVVYEDKQGTLWIGTGSPYLSDGGSINTGGLNRMNKEEGTFTNYKHDPNNNKSLISNKVSSIFEDNQGVLWVGTKQFGLHKMNRQDGTFEHLAYNPEHPEKMSSPIINPVTSNFEHITFINQDASGNYWFGTVENGLYFFNQAIGKIKKFRGTENSSRGFNDLGAWKAFNSRDGILWIGTAQGNIYRINPLQNEIPHFDLTSGQAISFYEESNGNLWIGTTMELLRQDKKSGITKRYLLETDPAGNNSIDYIYEDSHGDIWVGGNGGLAKWNKEKENFKRYKINNQSINFDFEDDVLTIFEDRDLNLWIGTVSGLRLFDRKTGVITYYFPDPNNTSPYGRNFLSDISQDDRGNLWISYWYGGGVKIFNPETEEFKSYLHETSITNIREDENGVMWAGGYEGLYKFDRNSDKFIRYDDSNLLANTISDVRGMIVDNENYLWIASPFRIVRLNPERNKIRVFGRNYGIGKNLFEYVTNYKGRNGKIYFGDDAGYISFNPNDFKTTPKPPEIVFTQFSIENEIVKSGYKSPVKTDLTAQTEIHLDYNQNIFSIDFAAIDYTDPGGNSMQFMLENYDNNWRTANSEGKAYYFNIKPGKYVFRVKAVNSSSIWARKKMDIIILPPWYRSTLAYGFYALLFVAFVFGIDRIQRRRIVMLERKKTQERELEQAKEIEKAYTELKATQTQLIQSEKMASLGELTAGIAHEIQNPLNFVNNFSEVNKELLEEMNEEIDTGNLEEVKLIAKDVIDNEEKINYHGKRADAIVKGMLQHSRSSNGIKEPTDINVLADEYLRLAYHGLRAKDKSFNADFKTEFDETLPIINVISQDIGRVILNLITNAFYAVSEARSSKPEAGSNDYKPEVIVSTKKSGNKIEIRVKDNGQGIRQEVREKIFQPFFTTKPTGSGTGLGLSLSYDIVKAHGGEIKVDTKEGEGTEFTIILPA